MCGNALRVLGCLFALLGRCKQNKTKRICPGRGLSFLEMNNNKPTRILVVEDDSSFLMLLSRYLEQNGYAVDAAGTSKEAVRLVEENSYHVVLTDLMLPEGNGINLIKVIKDKDVSTAVVLMTSHGQVRSAVQAIKNGAYEYLTKPIDHEELLAVLGEAVRSRRASTQRVIVQEQERVPPKLEFSGGFIAGGSEQMTKVLDQALVVSSTELSVLVHGESGTGKEYLSRFIHENSHRKSGSFISVDCGALSEELASSELFGHVKGAFTGATSDKKGQFELANGGTIFLDEIGNLSYEVQVKLLRAIQERMVRRVGDERSVPIDVRLICATNDELKSKAREGVFREDLYHRINEFELHLPPLRERGKDLEVFVSHFIKKSNEEFGKNLIGPTRKVMHILSNYHWSGNIRELKNVIRRGALLEPSDHLREESLPVYLTEAGGASLAIEDTSDLHAIKEANEIQLIRDTLKKNRYNKSRTARELNINRTTLYDKLKKYHSEIFSDQA